MPKYNNQIEKIKQTISDNITMSAVARTLGIPLTSLLRICKQNNIEYTTCTDIGFSDITREKIKNSNKKRHLEQLHKILSGELSHKPYNSSGLRKRLIDNHILPNKCSICNIDAIWNNTELTLHLDHISGNDKDNRLSNLRLLCPNCHSQTPTYAGKNIKNKNKDRFNNLESIIETTNPKSINELLTNIGIKPSKFYYSKVRTLINEKKLKTHIPPVCKLCGKLISANAKNGLCTVCSHTNQRKVDRPTKDHMIELLKVNSIVSIAKIYSVSDKAIIKWLLSYDLPTKRNDIKQYLNTCK